MITNFSKATLEAFMLFRSSKFTPFTVGWDTFFPQNKDHNQAGITSRNRITQTTDRRLQTKDRTAVYQGVPKAG